MPIKTSVFIDLFPDIYENKTTEMRPCTSKSKWKINQDEYLDEPINLSRFPSGQQKLENDETDLPQDEYECQNEPIDGRISRLDHYSSETWKGSSFILKSLD